MLVACWWGLSRSCITKMHKYLTTRLQCLFLYCVNGPTLPDWYINVQYHIIVMVSYQSACFVISQFGSKMGYQSSPHSKKKLPWYYHKLCSIYRVNLKMNHTICVWNRVPDLKCMITLTTGSFYGMEQTWLLLPLYWRVVYVSCLIVVVVWEKEFIMPLKTANLQDMVCLSYVR